MYVLTALYMISIYGEKVFFLAKRYDIEFRLTRLFAQVVRKYSLIEGVRSTPSSDDNFPLYNIIR